MKRSGGFVLVLLLALVVGSVSYKFGQQHRDSAPQTIQVDDPYLVNKKTTPKPEPMQEKVTPTPPVHHYKFFEEGVTMFRTDESTGKVCWVKLSQTYSKGIDMMSCSQMDALEQLENEKH